MCNTEPYGSVFTDSRPRLHRSRRPDPPGRPRAARVREGGGQRGWPPPPPRRPVRERLGSGSATVSELAQPFGMSLTGMKKHIRLLEEAELVTTEKGGRVRSCMLAPYAFEGISPCVQRLDRFAAVVERTKGAR